MLQARPHVSTRLYAPLTGQEDGGAPPEMVVDLLHVLHQAVAEVLLTAAKVTYPLPLHGHCIPGVGSHETHARVFLGRPQSFSFRVPAQARGNLVDSQQQLPIDPVMFLRWLVDAGHRVPPGGHLAVDHHHGGSGCQADVLHLPLGVRRISSMSWGTLAPEVKQTVHPEVRDLTSRAHRGAPSRTRHAAPGYR
jgi:hypothetical protein